MSQSIMQYEYPFADGFSFGALVPTAEDAKDLVFAGGTAAAAMVVVPLLINALGKTFNLQDAGIQGWAKRLTPAVIGLVGFQVVKQYNPTAAVIIGGVGVGLTVMSLIAKFTGGAGKKSLVPDPLAALPDEETLVGLLNGLENLALPGYGDDQDGLPEDVEGAEDESIGEGESVTAEERMIAGAEVEERTIAGFIGVA